MPREELMQYVAQVFDITAKSTRGYDLSCSLSLQLYTDADVYVVQIRPLTWSVWLIDWMLVGWLVTYLFLLIWMENCDHLLGIFCQEAGWWKVMKSFQLGAHTGALTLIYIDFPFNSNLNSSLTLLLNFKTQ